jgi:hypothetical protein
MWLAGAAVAVLVVAGVWLASRGGEQATPGIGHVHGLGVNPADGLLYVAAHNGVFRVRGDGQVRRVGEGAQDTMGFTILGPDHFLASGHPAPLQGGPDHLGLIESTNGGVRWQTLSLAGEADFHALAHRHDTIYGYDALSSRFIASHDGTEWDHRSQVELFDFAVNPTDPATVLATTSNGLVRSTDGGRTWAPAAGAPPVVLLAWESTDRLWGLAADGELLRSANGGRWSTAGTTPSPPSAFAAHNGDLYLAAPEQGIFHSGDGGATWNQLHP